MQEDVIIYIDYNAEKEEGGQTLDGTFDLLTSIPKYTTKVIDILRILQVVRNRGIISTTTTVEEYIQGR